MAVLKTIKTAADSAKKTILENIGRANEYTGTVNLYGDQTLVLDLSAEDEIISVLQSSDVEFTILTEEKGVLTTGKRPEYLALVDPLDGSANLRRGIPLASVGISIVPLGTGVTSDDIEISVIDSVFSNETYVAVRDKGVTLNGKKVTIAAPVNLADAIISYDTKRAWDSDFLERSMRVMSAVHDIRRTASNLLDLCWTAAGRLDAMVDMRNKLPIIHICGTHMVFEAGGFVLDQRGERFRIPLGQGAIMNFVAASNKELARLILDTFEGPRKHP
jgi:myo-inositol-1(or 4)-monophosphatase